MCANYLGWQKDKKGRAIIWQGNGLSEVGIRFEDNKVVVD